MNSNRPVTDIALWPFLLLVALCLACSPKVAKGPTKSPRPADDDWVPVNEKGAYFPIADVSEGEIYDVLCGLLVELGYSCPGRKQLDGGFQLRTGFYYHSDQESLNNLFVRVALRLQITSAPQRKLTVSYGVAWAPRKENDWKYGNFPQNMQTYLAQFDREIRDQIQKLRTQLSIKKN